MNRFSSLSLWSLLLGLMLFTAACNKDKDGVEPGGIDGTPAFVGKSWQLSAFTLDPAQDLDGDGKPDADLMKFMRPCDKDNTVTFEKNGKLSGSNGKLKCDDDEPTDGSAGRWSYNADTKILTITDEDGANEWKIIESTGSTLKAAVEVLEEGNEFKAVMTWKAV